MTNRDPFAEEEVEFAGPKKTDDAEPFDDAYTFDEDDDGPDFAFGNDDDPDDWAPPVTPAASATRQFTGGKAPSQPTRPARTKTAAATGVITLPDETFVPQTSAPVKKTPAETPEEHTTPSSPRRRPAPDMPQTTNRSLKDRLLALFRGRPADPGDEEMRAITRKLTGTVNVAFVNRKGGVGKTLTTTLTGQTLATHRRGDRVIALTPPRRVVSCATASSVSSSAPCGPCTISSTRSAATHTSAATPASTRAAWRCWALTRTPLASHR